MVSIVLPPNQHLATPGKWPVVGEKTARESSEPWTVAVSGLVERPRSWSLDDIRVLGIERRAIDIHCVTRWSKPAVEFAGVPLQRILEESRPKPEARFVSFVARSERNHSTSLPLDEAVELKTLVALEADGAPLPPGHGGPIRTVVPGRYFYKSLKWLERIELLAEDRQGYWEAEAGYHNVADPWREERYGLPTWDPLVVRQVLWSRDLSNGHFLSLDAHGRELNGLKAEGALLRNADFRDADLRNACFDGTNLSNAHMQGANLQSATFRRADVEGADFCGADLRCVDFTGASLFGVTFAPDPSDVPGRYGPARIDATTRLDADQLDALTPMQSEFIRVAAGTVKQ